MNLPNKLSLIRLCLIPVFTAVYFIAALPFNFLIAGVIFAIAATTDFLDGHIARKYNLVTDFGKFLDPIADKVLVATAFIVMLVPVDGIAILPWYCAIGVAIIIARELIVSGFRMVAANKGMVLAADKAGKIKTVVQDLCAVLLLVGKQFLPEAYSVVNIIGLCFFGLAVLLTVISGTECIVKNVDVLRERKE